MKKIIFFFLLITSCKTIEPTTFIEYEKIGFAEEIKNENIKEILFNIVSVSYTHLTLPTNREV